MIVVLFLFATCAIVAKWLTQMAITLALLPQRQMPRRTSCARSVIPAL
jgi:hypothetical protein